MSLTQLVENKKKCQILEQYDHTLFLNVAPQVVARTRFSALSSKRKHLSAEDAAALFNLWNKGKDPAKSLIMLSGPGDPLATPELTAECIKALRKNQKDISVGIQSLGIHGSEYAAQLSDHDISLVELKIDGVRQQILEKIYAWIRPGSKTLQLHEAVKLLMREQRNAVSAFSFHSIPVSIATTLYPGYNLDHVTKICAEMVELGANCISIIPYQAASGSEVHLDAPTPEQIAAAKEQAGRYLPVNEPLSSHGESSNHDIVSNDFLLPKPTTERPNVAVVSSNGMDIDLHLGHANRFLIYGPRKDGLHCLLEHRNAPESGGGDARWIKAADILDDCFSLLTVSAGSKPRQIFAEKGLHVSAVEGQIEPHVETLFGVGKKKRKRK